MRFALTAIAFCLLLNLHTTVRADAQLNVVVSVKPLHALVLGVMQGVASPALLLDSTQSPHQASLRPSDMRTLSKADLVFWIGPQLETFMPRVLHTLKPGTSIVSLMDNPHLALLPQRGTHAHNDEPANHEPDTAPVDPHIWLSTRNADLMVEHIAQTLIKLDPVHTAEYSRNAKHMHLQIDKLRQQITSKLKKTTKKFISYHDAYQYFENEFGLQNAGVVAQGDELQPSAHHIRELRQQIRQQDITCVVYDAPRRPAIISTLLSGTSASAVELDALGLNHPQGSQTWFELVRTLAENLSTCLGN